jgi:hypothetical protein
VHRAKGASYGRIAHPGQQACGNRLLARGMPAQGLDEHNFQESLENQRSALPLIGALIFNEIDNPRETAGIAFDGAKGRPGRQEAPGWLTSENAGVTGRSKKSPQSSKRGTVFSIVSGARE